MWTKIAIAGAVGAAILGTGAAALAETGASGNSTPAASSTTSPSSTGAAKPAGEKLGQGRLRGKLTLALGRFEHGSWVSTDKSTSAEVTHNAVKGTVSAVSATSITVQASDGFNETFVVNSDTAVRVKGIKGKTGISAVKVADTVLVDGATAGSTATAMHVLDGGAK